MLHKAIAFIRTDLLIKTSNLTLIMFNNNPPALNLIQGPLAGISSAPFRSLVWRYSQPLFSCTEMISCKTLIHQSPSFYQRFTHKHADEGPVCFQLAGSDPKDIALATKIVTDCGADIVDLNCGCPVKKIRQKKAGSYLLSAPSQLYALASTMKNSTHLPVSIKIRVDGQSNERCNIEIAKVVADAGIDFLVVHARHWTEGYDSALHYADLSFFVESLKIPVIGNGDVASQATLDKILSTGCKGAMISRASLGQPWLIGDLKALQQGQSLTPPAWSERGQIFIEHIQNLSILLGSELLAILHARKFAKYYARGLASKPAFCTAINQCYDLQAFAAICTSYFASSPI
jgi:tRNA-dihydrouridine synthase B